MTERYEKLLEFVKDVADGEYDNEGDIAVYMSSQHYAQMLLDDIERLPQPTWQPIETAPKDGTPILLAGGQDDEYHPRCSERDKAFMTAPVRAMWDGDSWLIGIADAGCRGISRENPTSWMPLPESGL